MGEKGIFQRRDDSGRPKAAADRKDRLIVRSAVTAPDSSSSTIRRTTRTRVSTMTFHRPSMKFTLVSIVTPPASHACTLSSQITRRIPLPTVPEDHRRRVWRRLGQRADPALIIARHTGPQPGVMLLKHFLGQPDLSPIEHIWDMMGRRLHLPGNVDDLVRQLKQILQEIPQENVRVLHHSMPLRVAVCIQAGGGSTHYWACYFVTM
ncbi:transposable element Tc1 transposase [Trichonephila clavipes]|nr:transposable element Tc1 transposase [Trichonephila clavipes]